METAAQMGLFKAEGLDRGGQTGEVRVGGVQSLRWDRSRSAGGSWSETGGKEGRKGVQNRKGALAVSLGWRGSASSEVPWSSLESISLYPQMQLNGEPLGHSLLEASIGHQHAV